MRCGDRSAKKPPISLEAYQALVGQEIGVSSWHVIDQPRIDAFANTTEDHQFIHVDPERARAETAFGTTIAHGFLTMSMMSVMSYEVMPAISGTTMGVNYGLDKVRFLNPVRAGKRVRAHCEILTVDRKDANRFLVKQAVTVEIEGEETPAVYAEWLGMSIIG